MKYTAILFDLDGTLTDSQLGISDKTKVLMIGDRFHDISAANETGIESVGVLWGYGGREEFEKAGATYIVETPSEILDMQN